MTETAFSPVTANRAVPGRLAPAWKRIVAGLRLWRGRRRSRKRLAELDDWLLRDIGLPHPEAAREVRRSFPWHRSFPWYDGRGVPYDPWR